MMILETRREHRLGLGSGAEVLTDLGLKLYVYRS